MKLVMAYIVIARHSYGLYSYGLSSYGAPKIDPMKLPIPVHMLMIIITYTQVRALTVYIVLACIVTAHAT